LTITSSTGVSPGRRADSTTSKLSRRSRGSIEAVIDLILGVGSECEPSVTKSTGSSKSTPSSSCSAPDEVGLYTSPWVSSTRALDYYGPIRVDVFLEHDRELGYELTYPKAQRELFAAIKQKAYSLGGNAVVGVEVQMNPFHVSDTGAVGLQLIAIGTVANLVRCP